MLCEHFAYVHVCTPHVCVCGACRGQKRALNPLGLELILQL